MRLITTLTFAAILTLTAGTTFATPYLTELRIDQGGADNDEYFELAGTPGEALDGYWLIVIGDGTGLSGVVESVTDLSGYAIQADGVFAMGEATWTGTCGSIDATGDLNFENSDNLTFLLVQDFTGLLGDDLDIEDDGVLDEPMPFSNIIDSVALVETLDYPASGEYIYSDTIVGPDGVFVPGHAAKCNGIWFVLSFDLCTITETPGEPSDAACGPVPNLPQSFDSLKALYR